MNWRNGLAEQRLPFLEVRYESLVADFAHEFAHVLDHLGLDPAPAKRVKADTLKMGSGNDEIVDRYLSFIGAPGGS
jgi:LPS sulfotransferase NodH